MLYFHTLFTSARNPSAELSALRIGTPKTPNLLTSKSPFVNESISPTKSNHALTKSPNKISTMYDYDTPLPSLSETLQVIPLLPLCYILCIIYPALFTLHYLLSIIFPQMYPLLCTLD